MARIICMDMHHSTVCEKLFSDHESPCCAKRHFLTVPQQVGNSIKDGRSAHRVMRRLFSLRHVCVHLSGGSPLP